MTIERSADNTHLRMVMPSVFDELETVVEETEQFVAAHASDDEFVYKVVLLASEAVTNAMEHGNDLDAEKSVEVDLLVRDGAVELWVQDEGEGFEPKEVPDPVAREHLLAEGGRGIFLMEQLADEVRIEDDGRRIGLLLRMP